MLDWERVKSYGCHMGTGSVKVDCNAKHMNWTSNTVSNHHTHAYNLAPFFGLVFHIYFGTIAFSLYVYRVLYIYIMVQKVYRKAVSGVVQSASQCVCVCACELLNISRSTFQIGPVYCIVSQWERFVHGCVACSLSVSVSLSPSFSCFI